MLWRVRSKEERGKQEKRRGYNNEEEKIKRGDAPSEEDRVSTGPLEGRSVQSFSLRIPRYF